MDTGHLRVQDLCKTTALSLVLCWGYLKRELAVALLLDLPLFLFLLNLSAGRNHLDLRCILQNYQNGSYQLEYEGCEGHHSV